MARPVIALLTDFGLRDHYVGAMKGVMLGVCPDATLVDITHDMPPHDVRAGALELAASLRVLSRRHDLPRGRRSRRGLGAPRHGRRRRRLPLRRARQRRADGGVRTNAAEARRRADRAPYARPTVSRTFEGRDRFAPAAAWLAKGVALTALGRALTRYDAARPCRRPSSDGDGLAGEVVRVDRFGNLVTNIDRTRVERLSRDGAIDDRDRRARGAAARGHLRRARAGRARARSSAAPITSRWR